MTQRSAKRPAVRARWEVSDTPLGAGAFAPAPVCLSARAPAAAAAGILVRVGRPAHIAARAAAAPAAAAAAGRGPAHTAAASAAAGRAAPLRAGAGARARRVRRRRPSDRAGRLLAARIAAPLLDKVRECQAAEAVTETSHCAYLQKNLREHRFPEHSMPCVRVWCQALSVFASMGGTGASTISCGWLCGLCGCFIKDSPRR